MAIGEGIVDALKLGFDGSQLFAKLGDLTLCYGSALLFPTLDLFKKLFLPVGRKRHERDVALNFLKKPFFANKGLVGTRQRFAFARATVVGEAESGTFVPFTSTKGLPCNKK